MRLLAWALTDTGKKREHNEDSYLVAEDLGLFAVADGMGGHQGGEHASRLALQVLYQRVAEAHGDLVAAAKAIEHERREELIERLSSTEADTWGGNTPTSPLIEVVVPPGMAVLRDAARRASWAVFDAALTSPHLRGMGTTLTAIMFVGDRVHLCHAGDSRCYLLRDGAVRQLTDDHTWIAEQVKNGTMTEVEAKQSRYRHVITRSVGFEREVEVDVRTLAVEAGDCFVVCSDGLSNHLGAGELERMLGATWFRRAPQRLVDLANQRGGDDNCTVIVILAANDAGPA
ncbi:MAG: serine/threonine-protein phosphatase [Kofleriaceae bacterium]|jgi:serine/threonine protein phosphatase PrpC|nr:serine/threonine-protein phosphatase [Kofleriaceae bacterium]MBP9172487.1 serine/threonine-protein phosphatase [Kofleriaceae bacterium]MBP9862343.1 serine/threonine-protein phosphatase [Kofleriaceae bacterium]